MNLNLKFRMRVRVCIASHVLGYKTFAIEELKSLGQGDSIKMGLVRSLNGFLKVGKRY